MKIQIFLIVILINELLALYIKPLESQKQLQQLDHKSTNKLSKGSHNQRHEQAWHIFKKKLGLTDEKVNLLKSQKDQRATIDLLNRFIKENPKYDVVPSNAKPQENPFTNVYHDLLAELKKSNGFLKASLNVELPDKSSHKSLKRSRRKIAVRMVSDMPSAKIDALLEMFNQQHGLDKQDSDDNEEDANTTTTNETIPVDENETNEANDYPEYPFGPRGSSSKSSNSDYMYENLWEDEEDHAAPTKSSSHSQYASFQDLILQANRNQWHREQEETKLRTSANEDFA